MCPRFQEIQGLTHGVHNIRLELQARALLADLFNLKLELSAADPLFSHEGNPEGLLSIELFPELVLCQGSHTLHPRLQVHSEMHLIRGDLRHLGLYLVPPGHQCVNLLGDLPLKFLPDGGQLVRHHLSQAHHALLDDLKLPIGLPLLLSQHLFQVFVSSINVLFDSPDVKFKAGELLAEVCRPLMCRIGALGCRET